MTDTFDAVEPFSKESLIVCIIPHGHLDQIVVFSRYEIGLENLWHTCNRSPETIQHLVRVFLQGYFNKDKVGQSQSRLTNDGHIPLDRPVSFQSPHPGPAS